eukprot:1159860-Pelagomonas_calceolata.AAC.3
MEHRRSHHDTRSDVSKLVLTMPGCTQAIEARCFYTCLLHKLPLTLMMCGYKQRPLKHTDFALALKGAVLSTFRAFPLQKPVMPSWRRMWRAVETVPPVPCFSNCGAEACTQHQSLQRAQ